MASSLARMLVLTLCVTSVVAAHGTLAPSRTTRDDSSTPLNPVNAVTTSVAMNDLEPLTNGQRFARGLPPNRPRRAPIRRALKPRQSAAACSVQTQTGFISTTFNSVTGYLAAVPNSFGEFYTVTPTTVGALQISFCPDPAQRTFAISTVNGFTDYPFLGVVQGFTSDGINFKVGSPDYTVFVGIADPSVASPAITPNSFTQATSTVRNAESAIWLLRDNNQLVPTWINSDGSLDVPVLLYTTYEGGMFVITGDAGQFAAKYNVPISNAVFTFISTAAAPSP